MAKTQLTRKALFRRLTILCFSSGTGACSGSSSSDNQVPATRIIFDAPPLEARASECVTIRVKATGASGEAPTIQPGYTLSLAANQGSFYLDETCEEETQTSQIPTQSSSATVSFMSKIPGTAALQATVNDQTWVSATHSLNVLTDALRLAFEGSSLEGRSSECLGLRIKLLNGKGNNTYFGRTVPLTLSASYLASGDLLGEFFSDSGCTVSSNRVDLLGTESETMIYFLTHVPGEYKVNLFLPSGAELDRPTPFDLAARTVIFGSWRGPCTVSGGSRVQKSLEIDDRDLRYITTYYSGSSGSCSLQDRSHWTEFTANYSLPSRLAQTLAPIDVVYRSSCLGVSSPNKASEFRTSETCGINSWTEDDSACTTTTDNGNCPGSFAVNAGQQVFDIFTTSDELQPGSGLQFGAADLLPTGTNSSVENRPNITSGTSFILR